MAARASLASPASFAQLDAAGIPEPILEDIGLRVHRLRFNDGLKAALEDPRTPFERSCDQDLSLEAMIKTHQIETFIDINWFEWLTVVFYLPATRTYIVYYHYEEIDENYIILMEIAIENFTRFRMVRFYGKSLHINLLYPTFDAYRVSSVMDWTPFHFLAQSNIACIAECTDGTKEPYEIRTDTCREWRDAERTIEWFSTKERLFNTMANKH